jgi:sulfur carrier protein ThiS
LKIHFKLFASLKEYLPSSTKGNQIEIEVAPGTTPAQLIEQYQLPPKLAHLVLVNGHYIEPDRRAIVVLQEGDALAIWPPVAGG